MPCTLQKLRFRCSFMVPFQRYVMLRLCSEGLAAHAKPVAADCASDGELQRSQAQRWDARKFFIWACVQPSVIAALDARISRPGMLTMYYVICARHVCHSPSHCYCYFLCTKHVGTGMVVQDVDGAGALKRLRASGIDGE